jgi:drug/metabolite transporter (DMT)-like permease
MSGRGETATVVGVGAVACAVCCAGPIVGFFAAIGLGTVAGAALFGTIGLLVAAAVGTLLIFRRRHRQQSACAPADVTVGIEPPRLRSPR